MNKNAKKKRKGFTLIELIIVLAIMAIIAAIAIPNFTSIRDNSKNKADAQSAQTIKRAVLMLVADGTVKTDAAKTFKFTDGSAGITPVSGFPADLTTTDEDESLNAAIKEVKKPQGKIISSWNADNTATFGATAATTYNVTISTSGDVVVTTIHE